MRSPLGMTRPNRPWRRPGAAWYAVRRLWPRNPLTGQFPASYQQGPKGRCTVHWGPQHQAQLLVPIIP